MNTPHLTFPPLPRLTGLTHEQAVRAIGDAAHWDRAEMSDIGHRLAERRKIHRAEIVADAARICRERAARHLRAAETAYWNR